MEGEREGGRERGREGERGEGREGGEQGRVQCTYECMYSTCIHACTVHIIMRCTTCPVLGPFVTKTGSNLTNIPWQPQHSKDGEWEMERIVYLPQTAVSHRAFHQEFFNPFRHGLIFDTQVSCLL